MFVHVIEDVVEDFWTSAILDVPRRAVRSRVIFANRRARRVPGDGRKKGEGWMNGWMNGWMDGWMNIWMDR